MALKNMKHSVNRYFKLWLAFFRNTLSRDMEFKMNFIFEIFIDIIYYGSLFFFFQIIFQFTDSLGDFNKYAVIRLPQTVCDLTVCDQPLQALTYHVKDRENGTRPWRVVDYTTTS